MRSEQTCNQRGLGGARIAPPLDGRAAFVAIDGGAYRLEAPLIFATVPTLRQPGLELIAASQAGVDFDLQRVSMADSAGLALLVDWLAEAGARQRTLRYLKVPEGLSALAALSDVEALIEPSAEQLNATTAAAGSR